MKYAGIVLSGLSFTVQATQEFDLSVLLQSPFGSASWQGSINVGQPGRPLFFKQAEMPSFTTNLLVNIVISVYNLIRAYQRHQQYLLDAHTFVDHYKFWSKEQFKDEACKKYMPLVQAGIPGDEIQQLILSEYHLYQFSGFRHFVKELPLYPQFIKQLRNRLATDHAFKTVLDQLPGFFECSFTALVLDLDASI